MNTLSLLGFRVLGSLGFWGVKGFGGSRVLGGLGFWGV